MADGESSSWGVVMLQKQPRTGPHVLGPCKLQDSGTDTNMDALSQAHSQIGCNIRSSRAYTHLHKHEVKAKAPGAHGTQICPCVAFVIARLFVVDSFEASLDCRHSYTLTFAHTHRATLLRRGSMSGSQIAPAWQRHNTNKPSRQFIGY